MKHVLLIYCLFSPYVLSSNHDDTGDETLDDENEFGPEPQSDYQTDFGNLAPTSDCWMSLNAKEYYDILDDIDSQYSEVRQQVQEAVQENDFDDLMIKGFVRDRGVALRDLALHQHKRWLIPSGINLGGYCMLRMPESILFFHRMKLRNNTHFRVEGLHNELDKMVVTIKLSLNDLHLKGAYERSLTDTDPSVLIYAPTFGEVELLLKDVKYKVEGRYRLINQKLLIELVSSEIFVEDVLMTYVTQIMESSAIKISTENLGAFMSRLKIDLDKWIKDYFNDYMIYAQMDRIPHIEELAQYDKEKGTALEEFTDYALRAISTRIRLLDAESVRVPSFTFKTIHGLQIKLFNGVLNGLDSIYRRSVATGYKENGVRKVDSLVGFSSLKVVYNYQAVVPTGVPPIIGSLTLLANDLTAHMALAMVSDPETVDLDLEFLDQTKPESLTVEGAANVMISNFKHLLEHQIIAVMSNTLIHGVVMLKSLPRCEPFVPGQIKQKGPGYYHHKSDSDPKPSSSASASANAISNLNDYDSMDSEGMLRVKSKKQRPVAKHPKSNPIIQSNRSKIGRDQKIYKKKTQAGLAKYKLKNKKNNKRTSKQEKNKI